MDTTFFDVIEDIREAELSICQSCRGIGKLKTLLTLLLTDMIDIDIKTASDLGSPHNSPVSSTIETKPGPRIDPVARLRPG